MNIKKIFKRFYKELNDHYGRHRSWDRCYLYFGTNKPEVELAYLHLTAFLASFGMYRGSGRLSKIDYVVNKGATEIILKYKHLRQFSPDVGEIMNLKRELESYYKNKEIGVSPTNTLISKIIFGTLGCTPAYDTYFLLGIKEFGIKNSKFKISNKFDKDGLKLFYDFYEEKKNDFEFVKKEVELKTKVEYPPMKLIDLYFWLIGDEKIRNKNKK